MKLCGTGSDLRYLDLQRDLGKQSGLPMTPNQPESTEPMFYYFAYGSCMCPVDLKRSLGENTHPYVVGVARLNGYRWGFYNYSRDRNCGCLDIVKDANSSVEGVLYQLPWRLSDLLDKREGVAQANYCHEMVNLQCQDRWYLNVRTYTVIQKLTEELAPNDWYFNVVLQGAVVCGLSQGYRWQLFEHMYQLQSRQSSTQLQIA